MRNYVCYHTGEGVGKDLAKAVDWYQKAPDQGDADAQFHLAVRYEDGKGVSKDEVKAFSGTERLPSRGEKSHNIGWASAFKALSWV